MHGDNFVTIDEKKKKINKRERENIIFEETY